MERSDGTPDEASSVRSPLLSPQVARVGALPGVTRDISAFRITENPALFLVDTPGVMVPKVRHPVEGLRLALIRAVPDSVVPADFLVGYMLEHVRTRKRPQSQVFNSGRMHKGKGVQAKPLRRSAIDRWLEKGCRWRAPRGGNDGAAEDEGGDDWREEDMEDFLIAVERESGAAGKPEYEARRMCCRYLLDKFREGRFGTMTLDHVPAMATDFEDVESALGQKEKAPSANRAHRSKLATDGGKLKGIANKDWGSADAWEMP